MKMPKKNPKKRKLKKEENNLKNVSIPKGIEIENIDLEKAKYLCSLPISLGKNPENDKDINNDKNDSNIHKDNDNTDYQNGDDNDDSDNDHHAFEYHKLL